MRIEEAEEDCTGAIEEAADNERKEIKNNHHEQRGHGKTTNKNTISSIYFLNLLLPDVRMKIATSSAAT